MFFQRVLGIGLLCVSPFLMAEDCAVLRVGPRRSNRRGESDDARADAGRRVVS